MVTGKLTQKQKLQWKLSSKNFEQLKKLKYNFCTSNRLDLLKTNQSVFILKPMQNKSTKPTEHQLKLLRLNKILNRKKNGKYTVRDTKFQNLQELISDTWDYNEN